MKISAVVICKNEGNIIAQCLGALSWVDETVLIDSGSSDRTLEIAKKYGARVFKRAWTGYAAQKNFGILKARGEWVLSLDADEIVTGELRDEILTSIDPKLKTQDPGKVKSQKSKVKSITGDETRNPMPETPVSGYYIPRRSFFYGHELRFGDIYPDCQLRLFKRGSGKYTETEIHERIEIPGNTARLKRPMLHYSKDSVHAHIDSLNSYTGLEMKRALKIGYRPTGYSVLIKPVLNFMKYFIFKFGFLDGFAGFIYQRVVAQYYFVKEVKIMQELGMGWGDLKNSLFKRAK
jgi:glycosyltransferase involved in cell wall biosynthesis